ncbi:MAG: ABC transporter substrate-binding protein [Acetobacteraceae bacterium]
MSAVLSLRTALGPHAHVRALRDGTVASERVRLELIEVAEITRAFRHMVRDSAFDVCEMALVTEAQAHAFGKPITALPVVLTRGFHHGAIVCRAASAIRGPRDLSGKRVGVRAYSQTTGVWVRGILHAEYGVAPETVTWVTAEDAHVEEFRDPSNVVRTVGERSLRQQLLDGDITAAIGLKGPDAEGTRTVIPNADDEAAVWYRKTGVYPVNHVVAVRSELLEREPWLGAELYALFSAAKKRASAYALPPASGSSRQGRLAAMLGADPLRYGMAANRTSIEMLLGFAAAQGVTPRRYEVADLFAKDLIDST